MNINNKITQIKKTTILIADIKSCYDNISIEWLDYFIDANKENFSSDGLKQWKILKKMYSDNHLAIGKNKFTLSGIPQGGFLSPFLCNFIISKIMSICIKTANINKDDIFIYADNLLLKNQDNHSLKTILSKFKIIQEIFKGYGLTFHEPKTFTINGLLELNFNSFVEDLKKLEPNSICIEEFKYLGIKFLVIKNKLVFNTDAIQFKFRNKSFELIPFKTFRCFTRYILSKFRYYYNILKLWNKNLSNNYLDWFKKETISFLKNNQIFTNLDFIVSDIINFEKNKGTSLSYWEYYDKNQIIEYDYDIDELIEKWTNANFLIYNCNHLLHEIFSNDAYVNKFRGSFVDKKYAYLFMDKIYSNIYNNKNYLNNWCIRNEISEY